MKIVKNNNKLKFLMLKEISTVNMGQSPSSESYTNNENEIPFFQGAADFSDKYAKIRIRTTSPKKIAPANSLLMTVRAPVGMVNFTNFDCSIGRGVCSIKSISKINDEYLYHYFNMLYRNRLWNSDIQGAIFEGINKDDLINKKIYFNENIIDKIVFLLNNYESKIINIKSLLEKIEIRNQYYSENLLSGEISIDDEGKIIKEIKEKSISFIENLITEYQKSKLDAKFGLKDGTYRFFKSSKEIYWSNDFIYDGEAVIMADGGKANVDYYNGKFSTSNHVYVFKSEKVNTKYLYYLLKSNIERIEDCFQGAALKNLSKKQFKNLEIEIFENIDYQNNIVKFLDKLEDEKSKVEKLLELEEKRFEWLSDKLLSGEYVIED